MKINFIKIFILCLCSISLLAQESEKVRIIGEYLKGDEINGKSVRIFEENVHIYQDNVIITCNKAVQFINDQNIELIGNVVVKRDSITLFTEHGYYNGITKVARSESGVLLNDGKMILSAIIGYYYSEEDRVEFRNDVVMFDNESKLLANDLTYWNKENKIRAIGNVKVSDTTAMILCDSLENYRDTDITYAWKNIKFYSPENQLYIFSHYFENNSQTNLAKALVEPFLMQIDTSSSGKMDTLLISSKTMNFVNDSTGKMIAEDSVIINRGEFSSKNSITEYYKDSGTIHTWKTENDERQPVLWFEENQMTGDTVLIELNDNELKLLDIKNDAMIVSEKKNFEYRFDQIYGDSLKLYFDDGKISLTDVRGHVLSIYYWLEDNKSKGLMKTSSGQAKLFFKDNQVDEVKYYISVDSEFHPETLIKGKEGSFMLPFFKFYKDRPQKKELFKKLKKSNKRYE